MKILRILLLVVLIVLLVIVVGAVVAFVDTTRGPLPQVSGTLNVPGLDGEVEILRDSMGVPHIYASTPHDLFFAQGFVQAQDRWWQMEFNRRIGRGEIQQLTGRSDAVMGNDLFIRTVGWRRVAEQELELLPRETLDILDAFAEGVNAYITSRPADKLALEYRLLGVTGVTIPIEPWSAIDTLVWAKVMAWNLSDSYGDELQREAILALNDEAMLTDYTPPWPYGQRPTIVQPEDLPLSEMTLRDDRMPDDAVRRTPPNLIMAGGVRAGESVTFSASLANDPGIGSNNWVATANMTDSGYAIIANDPHLGIAMPSIWYQIGLHCMPTTEDCPYNLVGFSFSSAPGIIIGHNAYIGWGVTNISADVQDLYRIRVNPDNPLQYEWNGEWRDMRVHEETIRFGDGEPPLTIQVRETHLGPIINDNRYDRETGTVSGFNNEDPLALRWTGNEPSFPIHAVVLLNRARNWTEFRQALLYWDLPSQNFVFADTFGHIGYQMPGRIVRRAPDHSGLLPVDGWTDAYEWRGYIPYENLPRIYNPERSYIATANQAVVPLEYYDQLREALGNPDDNLLFSYDWSYGQRGERIVNRMEALAPLSISDYMDIQNDNYNTNAANILPVLESLEIEDAALSEVRDWLLTWDRFNNTDSAQAVLFEFFVHRLILNVYDDQMPEDYQASSHQVHSLIVMFDTPENPWWDDVNTPEVETRDDILRRSLAEGYEMAVRFAGSDRARWRWGAIHGATFVSNPLGLSGISLIENLVNRGPFEAPGGYEIVNAASFDARQDDGRFDIRSLASMRMIIDFSDFNQSQWVITTGQSGHASSDHYIDQADLWRQGRYHNMWWSRDAVERAARERLLLRPSG